MTLNFIIFYLILAHQSPKGPLKTKALLIFFGFLLFYTALIAGNGSKYSLDEIYNGWLILLGPIGFIFGNIILIWGFNKKVV